MYLTGQDDFKGGLWDVLAGFGAQAGAALAKGLADPAVKKQLVAIMAETMNSPQVKKAFRPYIWESAAIMGAATFGAVLFAFLLARRA